MYKSKKSSKFSSTWHVLIPCSLMVIVPILVFSLFISCMAVDKKMPSYSVAEEFGQLKPGDTLVIAENNIDNHVDIGIWHPGYHLKANEHLAIYTVK